MKRWLVLALVAMASNAHADVKCYLVADNDQVDVQFNGDPQLRDLATWLVGVSCKDIIITDPAFLSTPIKVASGKRTMKQAQADAVAAIRAAGFKLDARDTSIVIKRAGARVCPGKATSGWEVPPPVPVANADDTEVRQAQLLAGIKVVSATEREIKEATIEAVLMNPMMVTKGARIAPALKDGKAIGIKFTKVNPVIAKLGFADNDVLKTVNGLELTSADKGLEVYTKLRETKRLELALERNGKPVTLVITVVK